jgi:NADP-dependent 3-hydroxy acid dehydrogenase YdfG
MTLSLDGKVALITGASSGVGLACAERMAAAGAQVVLVARRGEALKALGDRYPSALWMTGDLTDPAVVDAVFDLALSATGAIDYVVNNAGYMTSGPLQTIDLDKVGHMVRLNIESAYRVMYKAARHFQARDAGHLINLSSSVVARTMPEIGAYTGTKHAIEALAQSLRIELGRTNVRITNLQPGLIVTELHREYPEPFTKVRGISAPLTCEDVVDSIMFALAQPDHVRIPTIMIVPGESGQ